MAIEQSHYHKLMALRREKKRKRLKNLKRFGIFLLVIALIGGGIHCYRFFSASDSVAKAKSVKAPDYVDIQLIHLGKARSGMQLKKIGGVVVHYTGNPGSTAQNNRDYFDKMSTEVCSHFVIGLDGEVIQCLPLSEKSAASNNRNSDTISIEVCHPDETGKFTDAAYDSLVKLTVWLCVTFDLKTDEVIRHYDVTGKLCPLYFAENPDQWQAFLSKVSDQLK